MSSRPLSIEKRNEIADCAAITSSESLGGCDARPREHLQEFALKPCRRADRLPRQRFRIDKCAWQTGYRNRADLSAAVGALHAPSFSRAISKKYF